MKNKFSDMFDLQNSNKLKINKKKLNEIIKDKEQEKLTLGVIDDVWGEYPRPTPTRPRITPR